MMDYGEPPTDAAWIPGADFACFMITKRCWKEVGRFDEKFFPAYFEDNDYHRRILMAGMQARIVPQAPYYHYGSKTQHSGQGADHSQFQINQGYYKRKWGGLPGAEVYATPFNIFDAPMSYMEE
jgi:GT2 family glycosyltransferase